MSLKRIIFYIYISISIFSIISIFILNIDYFDIILSLISLWSIFFLFKIGYIINLNIFNRNTSKKTIIDKIILYLDKHYIMWILMTLIFSIMVGKYYTGYTLIDYFGGIDAYSSYQEYFALNDLSTFSLSKLPFILMNAFNHFSFYSSVIYYFGNYSNKKKRKYLIVLIHTLTFLSFGLLRGTNFELFEILVCYVYIFMKRNSHLINSKNMLLLILAIICVCAFSSRIMSRDQSYGFYISPDVRLDIESLMYKFFPDLSLILAQLSGYFVFGLIFFNNALKNVIFNNIFNFGSLLIPNGFKLFVGNTLYLESIKYFENGTNWVPDIVSYLNDKGIIITCIIIIIFGIIARQNNKNQTFVGELIDFFICLQMFSFLLGNFVSVSSSNKICVFLLIISFIQQKIEIKV